MSVLSIFNRFKFQPKFLVPFIFVVGLLLKTVNTTSPVSSDSGDSQINVEKLPFCDEQLIHDRGNSKRNIYVTTLDGKVTTLDITKGSLQWSLPTEPGDLLSSSIHRLELTNNGKYVRMIPSLRGGIYKFDGESIEAIPVTADDLLKSSFKFSDDMVISGGRERRTYGVNSRTGSIKYEVSIDGRKNQNLSEVEEDDKKDPKIDTMLDDTIIVTRFTQTVRAIEPHSGVERWNFSIGHHEVEFRSNDNCKSQKVNDEAFDRLIDDLDLRVIVPEGIICGYSKTTPNTILWKHKFDSPIVSVYRMNEDNKLSSVDLFENVQWLWQGNNFFKPQIESERSPSIYLGMYQQQLYIQEKQIADETKTNLEQNLISDKTEMLKIPFKPYPASNTGLVKLIEGKVDTENDVEGTELAMVDEKLNAQAVLYASQYADGKGFYFFTDRRFNQSSQCKKTRSTHVNPDDFDNITFKNHGVLARSSSLWDYWKEISVIALTTALVINMMLGNRRRQNEVVYVTVPYAKEAIEFEEEEQQKKEAQERLLRNVSVEKIRSASESVSGEDHHYVSRFLADFDLVQCLGRGGFGVVFEVKNKLDDCHYAIKRILLPSKTESRERVMREVKTLANCEHNHIVRYFHAWVEQPPKGWQEQKDKELLARDILSTSITIDSPSPTDESKAFVVSNNRGNDSWLMNVQGKNDFSEFRKRSFTEAVDDSSSFIQFKADTNDVNCDEIFEDEDDSDESFKIEFRNETKASISEMPSEGGHVISFNKSNGESSSISRSVKKGHRRQMSLDLPSISDVKMKKSNLSLNFGSQKMYLYIQMQLCMKNSLKDWLRANDLQLRNGKTHDIWNQIIEAVHYVHLKGLIHRDLKPSNIFFALDGQIKIGDFGLVTDMAEIPVDSLTSSSSTSNSSFDFASISHKKHTEKVGTSLYMSPEQAKGSAYNYKVDIFSLGLILFELLNFFNTETERFKVLDNIRKHSFPSDFISNHKDEFDLLKLMLSKQPEERPTTYGIFSRPPLNKADDINPEWHFELPSRRRESQSSHNSLSK